MAYCVDRGSPMHFIKINITLRQLRAFSLINKLQSYSEAAETLSMTQGALSHLIRELESQLGFKVFERTTRKLELTQEGMRYLEQAEEVLAQVQKLGDVAQDILYQKNLQFRLGSTAGLMASELRVVLHEFSTHHPNIRIELKDYQPEELFSALAQKQIDLAIGLSRASTPDYIVQKILFRSPSKLVVSKDHPFAKRPFVRWSELANQTFIFHNQLSLSQMKNASGFDFSSCRLIELSQLHSILSVVESGEGVTIVASYAHKYLQVHDVVSIPIIEPEVMYNVGLFNHQEFTHSNSTQTFYDFIVNRYRNKH